MKQTLTDKFAGRLRHEIRSGRYTTEQPIPSERELARKYGISRVTARRSLRLLCQQQLLEARPARGYFVVPGASNPLDEGEAKAVLFIQRGVRGRPTLDTMHTRIVNGALAEAQKDGLELYIVCQQLPDFANTLRNRWGNGLRGVLLDWLRPDLAKVMLKEGIPFVMVEIDIEGLGVASVIQDNAGGVLKALEHLRVQGHERIGFVYNDIESTHPRQRLAGYREFFMRTGLASDPTWAVGETLDNEGGRRAAAALLDCKQRPSAVLICHREMIEGFCGELARREISCPRDLSLVVWGEAEPGEAGGNLTDLTHVSWSKEEMGRLAIRALEARIKAGRPERMVMKIETELIDRGSTAAPK
jgi:DNA-binding LacI/PurR family transcriptional regulator